MCYEAFGSPEDPTVLLIMGLGGQMLIWPAGLCEQIAARGYHVVRFDNRDVGLSTKFSGNSSLPRLAALGVKFLLGRSSRGGAYTLADMAQDATAVLDHFGVERAHIVGASMGGMIAQLFAAQSPTRTASLSIFFSSANPRFVVPPRLKMILRMFTAPTVEAKDLATTKAGAVDLLVDGLRRLTGRKYPVDEAEEALWRPVFHEVIKRGRGDAGGTARQLDAILASGSLTSLTARIAAPTVVIHGTDDPLVRTWCGKHLAKLISEARLVLVEGMGHSFPLRLWDFFIEELTANFARSGQRDPA